MHKCYNKYDILSWKRPEVACGSGYGKDCKLQLSNYGGVFKGWLSVIGGEVVIPDVDDYGSQLADRCLECVYVCVHMCILCSPIWLGSAECSFLHSEKV